MEPEYWLSSLPQRLLSSGALRFCCVCTASCCQVYGGHLGLLWCLCVCTQPVHSEGDQPWDFFGGNDAEAETPVVWPPHAKSWLVGKDSDAGRDWGQEENGTTEDEMAGWHHWLDGRESKWTPGVGDGQGGLACCYSWDHRVRHDWVTDLIWSDLKSADYTFFSSAHRTFSRIDCIRGHLGNLRNLKSYQAPFLIKRLWDQK